MTSVKQDTLAAFRMIFRPIAKILLLAGVTWREVAEIGKTSYVDVATSEFGIRGRPTNVSRVAILTGMARREVSRLRKLIAADDTAVMDSMNHATRVLTGWFTDPEFTDADGFPRTLADDGREGSFEALCKRYASDVPATAMRKELRHVGAIEVEPDGRLVARMRTYMPRQTDPAKILSSGSVLEDLGNTVAWNLYREDGDRPRFERRATNKRVARTSVPAFQAFLEREGQAFLERVDEWLTEHEAENGDEVVRLGLGTYWIEDDFESMRKQQ